MELFALLFFGSLGLGALLTGSSDEDDMPPEEEKVINGTDGDDDLMGSSLDDTLNGLAGDDTLHGDAGDDSIYGGEGDDTIYGGTGSDTILGGQGNDTLFGDSRHIGYVPNGNDVIHGGAGNDTLYDSTGDDELHGGSGDDILKANFGDDVLYGDAGDDVLTVGGGPDNSDGHNVLHGGAGDDTLVGIPEFNVGSGATPDVFVSNVFYGEEGNDELTGFGTLDGGAGDDILRARATVGEVDATTQTGGTGTDTFEVGNEFGYGQKFAEYLGGPRPETYDTVTITDFDAATESLLVTEAVVGSAVTLEQHGADTWVVLINDQAGYETYAMKAAVLRNVTAADVPASSIVLYP